MDMQLSADELSLIEKSLHAALPLTASITGMRTRQAGQRRFVEFNLLVPGEWPVRQSHELCDALEEAVRAEFADSDILIHVEPVEERAHFEVMP